MQDTSTYTTHTITGCNSTGSILDAGIYARSRTHALEQYRLRYSGIGYAAECEDEPEPPAAPAPKFRQRKPRTAPQAA